MDDHEKTKEQLMAELDRLRHRVAELEEAVAGRRPAEQAEAALAAEREFTEAALNALRDTVFVFDPTRSKAVRWNRAFEEVSGYSGKEIAAMKAPDDWYSEEDLSKAAAAIQKIFAQEHATVEMSLITKSGKAISTEYSAALIRDEEGNPRYIIAIGRDVTERKRAEQQIQEALEEKEALLRELYHRTKNNMQVVCAMLRLRSSYLNDERASHVFKEIEDRIQSMALVHQKLYQSQNLSAVNLKEYVRDLAALLLGSYKHSADRISLALEMVDDVFAVVDVAIPCGLILSELISNALQHAFPGDREGEIRIQLRKTDAGEIVLQVADDGVGVPRDFDFRRTDTLGLQTVFGLGERQLRGQVTPTVGHGVAWQVRFQDTSFGARV